MVKRKRTRKKRRQRKLRTRKPKRDYRAVIDSLRQVWKTEAVSDEHALWEIGVAERDALPGERIRLAVWNLCKGAGGRLFEHDFRSLCYRSDLVMAQEALLSKRSLRLFRETGFETIHAAAYTRRDGLRDGVMTASRATPHGPMRRIICKYPEPLLKTPKSALVKFFDVEGSSRRLMVINIHATLIRRKQAAVEEMEHLLAHLPEHEGPMLLAGDFNTFTPGYLEAVSGVLSKLGLHYVPIPQDPRPRTAALDQVFVRDLDVDSIVVDTTIKNSDHFPLLLTLNPREKAAP